ncbi:SdrD B-like domain-containing protein [Microbacterium sp. RG1]|uniref:SdrD B-like domain-containing protein n=1 Tax=Microbacterium sp. RG1 TaxID=2489212 RepID=UPI0010CA4A83|nr:SdrD B-like domain-containing protein [Microbacterium sp. RG1]QCQ18000.1 hypothetical protein EHF32_15435 [Microbacterium sp. RG1]
MRSPSPRSAAVRLTAGTTAVAVVAALCTLAGASAASAAGSTSGTVSGLAFRDFAANGVYDTGNSAGSGLANDLPLAGVGVTAVDRDGTVVATATTDASGAYTLAVSGAATDSIRVEFALSPAQLSEGYFPGAHGAGNGTSVQFVQLGATDVDFAALVPEDYIQPAPQVAVAAQIGGDPSGRGSTDYNGIVSVDWWASSSASLAKIDDTTAAGTGTGAIWGLAYDAKNDVVYSSAVLRRFAGLGEGGLGGVYATDRATGQTTLLADLEQLGIDVGAADLNAALGVAPTADAADQNAARGLVSDPDVATYDHEVYGLMGKTGIGGIAYSAELGRLFVVNVHENTLLSIALPAGGGAPAASDVTTIPLPSPAAAGSSWHPWAVSVHRGLVYVGGVTSPDAGTDRSGLNALAYTSPAASAGTWTPVLAAPLDYARGSAFGDGNGGPNATHWNVWQDEWDASLIATSGDAITFPQPIFASMSFNAYGEMELGFSDRFGAQNGQNNYRPDPAESDPATYRTYSAGDALVAAPDGTGAFVLESDGTVGGRTAAWAGPVSAGAGNDQGPGGGEFVQDYAMGHGAGATDAQQEIMSGATAAVPGLGLTMRTIVDVPNLSGNPPYELQDGTSGLGWSRASDGSMRQANVVEGVGFAKAGGLGGVAVLARLAPVEIGNRVWFDADQDGIQDADEPAVAGVTVSLTDASGNPVTDADGNPVAPVVTGPGGEYYFTNLVPNRTYTVTFATPTTGTWDGGPTFGEVPWTAMSFTEQAQGSDPSTDSNVNSSGVATVAVGGPGQNDHTIDAGLVADVTFTVTKRIAAGSPAPLAGQTFMIDVAGRDFRGLDYAVAPASVDLAADATSPAITVPIGTKVRVSESGDDSIASYVATYGTQTPDADGYALVVGTGSAPTAVEVTNTLRQPGTFSIAKALDDPSVSLSELGATTFTVAVGVNGTAAGTVQLSSANGFAYSSGAYPVGTRITLTETGETGSPVWADWGNPSWSTGDADGDGTAEIVVGEGANAALTLTNDITVLTGGFDVLKDVTGSGADRVPDDFTFTLEYSVDGGTTWAPLQLTDGQTVDGPQDLRVGTVVQVREVAPTGPADVTWQTPVFSGTGVTPGQPATLTIGAAGEVHVLLENPTEPSNGQFSLLKDVTGPGEPLLAPGTVFPVTYSYPGQPGGAQTVNLTNGTPWSSPALPTGTVVTVTEGAPTGGLPDGASWGTPSLEIDGVDAANGATLTIGADSTVAVVVDNPTDVTPSVELTKGDGDAGSATIAHEADSVDTGEAYRPGETRSIVIRVTNTGPEPLREVDLSDLTTAGGAITSLRWNFPDLSSTDAVWDAASGTWSAAWGATFEPGTTTWAVGDVIVGTATLTMNGSDDPHQDIASVSAKGAFSGKTVGDDNPYNAFTGGIQVIKYDGQKPDPLVGGPGGWITPTKPLVNEAQDANTPQTAVAYPVDKAQKVRWVVTNTGKTWLTNLTLVDVTSDAPAIGSDWTADLSAFGGPSDYSFVKDGAWAGLFPPGASFFAEGTLKMPGNDTHADTVTVTGTLVVPKPDPTTGLPTGEPLLDDSGNPVIAKDGTGSPIVFTDDDPFHARTPAPPLAITGSEVPWAAGGVAAVMLLLGAGIVILAGWRRRTRSGH